MHGVLQAAATSPGVEPVSNPVAEAAASPATAAACSEDDRNTKIYTEDEIAQALRQVLPEPQLPRQVARHLCSLRQNTARRLATLTVGGELHGMANANKIRVTLRRLVRHRLPEPHELGWMKELHALFRENGLTETDAAFTVDQLVQEWPGCQAGRLPAMDSLLSMCIPSPDTVLKTLCARYPSEQPTRTPETWVQVNDMSTVIVNKAVSMKELFKRLWHEFDGFYTPATHTLHLYDGSKPLVESLDPVPPTSSVEPIHVLCARFVPRDAVKPHLD